MSEKEISNSSSLVTVDVGSINTRAHYFDTVEGNYRLLARGEAPSTTSAPIHDLNLGVIDAIEEIEKTTGQVLLSEKGLLISPDTDAKSGANALTATFSGGPTIKVMTVGLLQGLSLQSLNHLVQSNYCHLVASFNLAARRKPEELIDTISSTLPEIILLAGGTNRGAARSVLRLANYLSLAINLLPESIQPEILFAGNEKLHGEIEGLLGAHGKLHFAPNIRPNLNAENIGPAAKIFEGLIDDIQERKTRGLDQLRELSGQHFLPTANAFGRTIQFLSHVVDVPKGMLGIDLGASNTCIAAAFGGELTLNVYSQLGMGKGISKLLEETHLEQIKRWLPINIPDTDILNYLYNKPLQPQMLPASEIALAIEHAAARQVMRLAIGKSIPSFPTDAIYPLPGTVPWFDRILVSGSTLSEAPQYSQSLMMVLDAIQPMGISTIILDQSNIAAALGAGAEINSLLSIQVLESNSFINLATVISPISKFKTKGLILQLQIIRDGKKQAIVKVNAGDFLSVPLPIGKTADIFIQPLQNMDIGLGPGNGGWVRRVVGGRFGIIIDARGRPIEMPTDAEKRIDKILSWRIH
jgi:hypothetical protein